MYLRSLGGLGLEGASFPRPKLLVMLAYLALEGAKSRRHLAELFWHGAAEPLTSVRMALRQVRQAVPEALVATETTVEARVRTDATDLLGGLEGGDPSGALALYRGAFLEGVFLRDWSVELEEWVFATREFLGERVRGTLLALAEKEAATGNFAEAAEWAVRACEVPGAPDLDPEGLERLYRLFVAGESPRAAVVRREAMDYGLSLDVSRDDARAGLRKTLGRGGPSPSHNLPARTTSFVGRDLELLELARLIADPHTRLITLTGPGGVGKSRLAVQAAYQELSQGSFDHGVCLVPLDALTDPDLVLGSVAAALGVELPARDDALDALALALADRHLLLILDNYEHLIAGASLASDLLRRCERLKLLVTSRERLGLEEEQLFQVEGLPLPTRVLSLEGAGRQDAVRLFVERAKRVQLDFALTTQRLPHLLRICELLGGSPLGIELAAASVRFMSPAEIAGEIERNLDFLAEDRRNVADRHKSLRATFDYSWRLLNPNEREVLRKLSVFVGGFTRGAASAVAGATIPLLASLVDKSLLRVLEGGRYDRHPLLYGYTQEKLAEHPEEQLGARAGHAAYCLALAVEAEAQHRGKDQVVWLTRLETEHDNLRAALDRSLNGGDPATGLKLAVTLYHFWYFRSYLSEGRRWLEQALGATRDAGPALDGWRSKALHAAGVLADEGGDYEQATAAFEARLALARKLGDKLGQAVALNSLGVMATERSDHARAREFLEESLALRRDLGQRETLAQPLGNLGVVALAQEDYPRARAYLEESLAISREQGDAMGVAICLANLGATLLDEGDDRRAQLQFEEGLRLFQDLGDKDGLAFCLEGLAGVAASRGRAREACRLSGSAEALRDAIGAPLSPSDRARLERRLAPARAALSARAFATAWTEGRAMSTAEATALASAALGSPLPADYQPSPRDTP